MSVNTADALNDVGNTIRAYATSVGNHAQRHYEQVYVDSGIDGTSRTGLPGNFHVFDSTAKTTDAFGLGATLANVIELDPGETIVLRLTWDDDFASATSDYDLYLLTNAGDVLVAFAESNNDIGVGGTGIPRESLAYTNPTGGALFYNVFIQNFDNLSPVHTLELFAQSGGRFHAGNDAVFNYNTLAGSAPRSPTLAAA